MGTRGVWHTILEVDTPGAEGRPLRRAHLIAAGTALIVLAALIGVGIRLVGEPQAAAVTPAATALAVPPYASAAAEPSVEASASGSTAMLPPAQNVLMLGDSLALSTYAWIADLLPDRHVSWEAQVGRTTGEARVALESLAQQGRIPPVVVVSSGTNDTDAATLRREAVRILRILGPNRCVVWADVVRPEDYGDGVAAANGALEAAWRGHANVIPVRWTNMIEKHPDWLTSDGVHPVEEGNIARAQAFADAVLRCSPLDPDAPVASKEYLPQASFLAPGGGSVPGVTSQPWSAATPARSSSASSRPTATRSPSTRGSAAPSTQPSRTSAAPSPPTTTTPPSEPPSSPAASASEAGGP